MKKEKTEELFVKWMDGELTPEEETLFATLLEEEPDLEKELAEMRAVSGMVSDEISPSVEPPYGDFFNSQLMRKIDLEIEAQRPAVKAKRWWNSLGLAWAPVGALALVLSFFAGHRLGHPDSTTVANDAGADAIKRQPIILPTVYSAGDSLDAEVIANAKGEVEAIVVNGIAAIDDKIDFGSVTSTEDLPEAYVRAEVRRFD